MFWSRNKSVGATATVPPPAIDPDTIAPSGWHRTREFFWQLPRNLTHWEKVEPKGRKSGPPAIVLPGFMSTDRSTQQLRRALARHGWRVHPWGLGMNKGARAGLLEELEARLDMIGGGNKVMVVGWSLGGLYARELAHRYPDKVRAVATLASPFCGDLKTNNNVRWLYERVAGHDVNEPPFERFEHKPPVPTMAFWSRKDGIVAPHAARGEENHCDCAIEIDTHHMGFAIWRPALSQIMRHMHDFLHEHEGAPPTEGMWRKRDRIRGR